MTSEGSSSRGFAVFIVRVAALWVLAGACLKLLYGSPLDLPRIVRLLPEDLGLKFRLAIAAELTIGLLALLKPRWAWLLLLTLLLMFDVVLITQMREGAPSCGCFGSSVQVPPVVMLVVDSILILLILVSRPWAALGRDGIHALALVMLLAVAVPLPWLLDREAKGGKATEGPGPAYVVFEVEKLPGTRLADSELPNHVPLDTLPADGLWIFYRNTCEVCADVLSYIEGLELGQRPLVLLQLPDSPDEESKVHLLPAGPHVHGVRLPERLEWTITPPAALVVRNGCVIWSAAPFEVPDYDASLDPEVPETCR